MLIVQAPAKINLTLEVLSKRRDGFHEIRSVAQTVSLCDSFSFQPSQNVGFESGSPGWIAGESLVSKTVNLVRGATGCPSGVTITVHKRIPLLSGLGGDSSDAAAVLRGLNQLWGLGLSREALLELARRLGSDVAFFLYGGTAMVTGRGELVTPLPSLPHRWVVLMMPPVSGLPGKTGQLYASLEASHYTDGEITRRLVEGLKAGRKVTSSMLFNTFENVSFTLFPGLSKFRDRFAQIGATDVHLAGSGPTLFTLFEDKSEAESLYTVLQKQGLESYLAGTLPDVDREA